MEKKLTCGLLCKYELNYSESIHIALIVKQGAYSDDNLPGTAHFLEHMLMEIREDIWVTDLLMKGTTSFEYTKYELSLKADYMEFISALSIIKGIVYGEFLNPYLLEKVRTDILDEYNAKIQNSTFKMESDLIKRIGLCHFMPIGEEKKILEITYADILSSFNKGYKLPNMKLCIVGGKREWEHAIDDIFELPGKISSRAKIRKENILARNSKYYNCLGELNCRICFIKMADAGSPYMDLIESMSLTMLEEMIKNKLGITEDLSIVEVIHYIRKVRFIKICIKNIDVQIKDILRSVYKKVVRRDKSIILLCDDIKKQYCDELRKKEYGYLYIQHLADCYIYNRKPYRNDELLEYIYKRTDIMNCLLKYLEKILMTTEQETHYYRINGGRVYYEK